MNAYYILPQHGPIHITSTNVFEANPFSWNTLADVVYVDQPVGKYRYALH